MSAPTWILLVYKAPPEPARVRVSVWRRLKGMAAVYLQSGVCLLPKTEEHVRKLKVIENDLAQVGGEAVILETSGFDRAQEEKVLARFKADRDAQYEEFIDKCDDFDRDIQKEIDASHFTYAELEENEVDFKKLKTWLAKIVALDFYGAPLAEEATRRLKGCETALESYAQQVFDAHDENK